MGALGRTCLAIFAGVLSSAIVWPAADDAASPSASPVEGRVRLTGAAGAAVRRALEGARARLSEPGCSRILSEFADSSARPLQERLDEMGVTASDYAATVVFVDGSGESVCRTGRALGATKPGSRVVALCGLPFLMTQGRDPRLAEAILIHEALHTLGLGENPPSSWEITTRILRACPAPR